jgi:phosphatidylglycerophosphatase A
MCFGIGHIKFAPGTFGAAAALPLALVLYPLGPVLYLTATAIVMLIAIWAASAAVERLGMKDPGAVVIDEVAGQLVALAFVPPTVLGVALGFFAFRFFDIVKPFPADRLEHLPGGPGVVLDDIAAGVYACLVVHAALRLLQFAGS